MFAKNKFMLAAALAITTIATQTMAAEDYQGFQAGDIMVRGRMTGVLPNTSSAVSPIGGHVDASNSLEPEVDLTYFFTPNIAIEGIAAITRHHLVDKSSTLGNVDLGHVTLLPPTITAQYHFLSAQSFSPYVGAGVNYTVFFDSTYPTGGTVHSINYQNSFGTALQIGADYHVQGNWFVNVDVKQIFLTTHAKINGGAVLGSVDINPTIVGLGIGYKF